MDPARTGREAKVAWRVERLHGRKSKVGEDMLVDRPGVWSILELNGAFTPLRLSGFGQVTCAYTTWMMSLAPLSFSR